MSASTSRIAKLARLAPDQRRDLAMAAVLLARGRWLHRRLPVARLLHDLRGGADGVPDPDAARRIAWAVAAAAGAVPWRSDCLIRAVAGVLWARRLGLPFEFHLGVRRGAGDALEAHAWTRSGDVVMTGAVADLDSFREFDLDRVGQVPLRFTG